MCVPFVACKPIGGGTNGGGTPGGTPTLPSGGEPFVKSIEITNYPHKTQYIVGETFSPTGLTFNSTWDLDGEEIVIDMNYSDCDSWTHKNEPLTLDVTEIEFTLEDYTFTVPITVEEGQADLPMTGSQLILSTTVSTGSSTTSIKENGVKRDPDEEVLYDHIIYNNLTAYKLKADGVGSGKAFPVLTVQGGGIAGTMEAGTRTKVQFMFKNVGKNPVNFRLWYDYGNAGGEIGSSGMIYLASDAVAVTQFIVRTDLVPESATPWFKIELLTATKETTLAVAGYDIGKIETDKYDLSLNKAKFTDGTDSVRLEQGDALPEISHSLKGTFMGYYNEYNIAEIWYADKDGNVDFTMPEHDVRLRPVVTTTGYQEKSVLPRATSGGARPEIHNGKMSKMGEIDADEANGYSANKVKYTIYANYTDKENGNEVKQMTAGTPVISGCGCHFDVDNDYDRLFKLTFTRISGSLSFEHWIDYEYEKSLVKNFTTVRSSFDAEHDVAVIYIIMPRGIKVDNGGGNFHIDPLADLTENAVFTLECSYARLA